MCYSEEYVQKTVTERLKGAERGLSHCGRVRECVFVWVCFLLFGMVQYEHTHTHTHTHLPWGGDDEQTLCINSWW